MQSMQGSKTTPSPSGGSVPDRTPLEKAVDKAFSYHPYRQPDVLVSGEWIIGPTFVVKGHYSCPIDGEQHPIWKADPLLNIKARGVLAEAREADVLVEVDKSGHDMEQQFVVDKFGAEHPRTAKSCTCRAVRDSAGQVAGELAFPLLSLAKKVKVDEWYCTPGGALLVGYAKGELVAVFALKELSDACRP